MYKIGCFLFLQSLLIFSLSAQIISTPSTSGRNSHPNFVLIVADDLGYGDLSFTGSTQVKTPHIDELAASGVFFPEGYVSSAVCSPSRAGLLTGRNQVSFGYDNNLANSQPGFDPAFLGLPVNVKTVGDHLKKLGYVTGLVGKWHLGYEDQFSPLNRGFDEFWGYLGGGHDYFEASEAKRGYKAKIKCNYKTPQEITYITDDKGDECINFIQRHKDEPFFLYASFNAPHTPMQATAEDLAIYQHIEDRKRRTYAAMVHRLDINVGRIVEAVEEADLLENTIFVFISDNGGPVMTNGSINAPYNGKKGTLLEGGIRVPFFISWPGHLEPGKVFEHPVSSLDLTPTFVALAGGESKEEDQFDGLNLMPYLQGEKEGAPHDEMKWKFTVSAAIREGKWKLVRLPDRLPMLFNLQTDFSEQYDVALENLAITKNLLKKLGDWDVRLPHPLFLEGAEWRKVQVGQYDKKYPIVQPR
ncbi:sulfatase-like hydrolase/transferase [Echinicola vietnamensis]|uniref:Arylsulfatase A family protein n=1 Tax=Echinicola vietnamensis (strain DSM 17526 / LMG 23754 / KMM 6221) TaxID=926556 RepID=L0FV01_ECHVK|nr:sulfatase-like hydrolase/transferase [Echinicola vietnamensis]AGA77729.1 arylsulfatase A family protein [Echinicola vietnamensis DSM 17526]